MRGGRRCRAGSVVGVLVGVLSVGLAGCTPPGPSDGPTSSPTPSDTPSPAVELPDDAAGRQAAWVLAQLAGSAAPTEQDVEERFADSFLAELSAAEVVAVLGQLRGAGPWTPTSTESGPGGIRVRITNGEDELDMQLLVDDDGAMTTLLFAPAPPPREPASSWSELTDDVRSLTAEASLYVAEVVDGTCVPLEGMPTGSAAGDSLPMGSVVKLYVLGAVVDAVGRGDLAWEDELTLTDELRSLPSGQLQDEPAGTVVSVREAAESMIAISDNTATDLLIDAVGREAVEQALVDMGHADPGRNVPLPSTRDLFALGWGSGGELRGEWRDADTEGRRALLERLRGAELDVDAQDVPLVAVWPFGVDWFGTGADLCAAHAALAAQSATPEGAPVREILSANPGLRDVEPYEHVAFKGGSATGTMAGAWYVEPAEGAPVVVVLQSASRVPQQAVHAETMVGVVEDALRLATS